jgi:hypothetical protein
MKACRLLLAVSAAIAWTGVASAQFAPQHGPVQSYGPGPNTGLVLLGGQGPGAPVDDHYGGAGVCGLDGHGPRSQDTLGYVVEGDPGVTHVGHWDGGHEWVDGEYFGDGDYVDCTDCGPRWAASGGWVAMKRVATETGLVAFNANPAGIGFVETINARDFDYQYASGVEAAILFNIDSCNAVEFRYLAFDDSMADLRRVVTAGGGGALPNGFGGGFLPGIPSVAVLTGPLTPFQRPASAVVFAEARSDMNSGEINVRNEVCCGRVTLIGGFRYINLNEKLTIIGAGGLGQQFVWKTDNDMFGFQAGTEIALAPVNEKFGFDAILKGGVYYNDATSDVFDSGVVGVGPRQLASGDDEVSFAGEAGIYATWRFSRSWSLRSGYQAFWLHSVAAAQDQVFSTGRLNGALLPLTHDTDTNSNVIYHGVSVTVIAEF